MLDPRVSRHLGPLEAEVMGVLWSVTEATVREATEQLNESRPEKPLAYTTVMTVMSRLAEKGMLSRQLVGKTFAYRANSSQTEFLAQLSNQRVAAVLSEFGELAVTQFLDHLERLDPEHLRRLAELAEQQRASEQT